MTAPTPAPVRPGQEIELAVESLAYGGAGVAHVGGLAVFVRGALPGQRVRARILKRRAGYAEARVEAVLARSPDETVPRCPHFGPCGGCLWQNLDYARQLEAKAAQVRDCLVRLGGLLDPPVEEPLGALEPYAYRNKMEFSFADQVWREAGPDPGGAGAFGCGLHVRGRFDKVLNLNECHLMAPWGARALVAAREAARRTGLAPARLRGHGGFFRFLILREGIHTGERMAILVTWPAPPGSAEEAAAAAVLESVHAAEPLITSLIHGVSGSRASVAFCESHRALHGPPVIRETLLGETFEIGPNTFFQTNTRQAERLFTRALAEIPDRVPVTYDLYCGVGALTLPLARRAGRVVGVDIAEASIEAARANANRGGVANAAFLAADMKAALTRDGVRDTTGALIAGPADLVLVDPPRAGLHADVARALVALAPPRLVYISCNPATLARDAALLAAGGYALRSATPVDMFPQTAHVEVVAAFHLAGDGVPGDSSRVP